MIKKNYLAPSVEVMTVNVEKGFAGSLEGNNAMLQDFEEGGSAF